MFTKLRPFKLLIYFFYIVGFAQSNKGNNPKSYVAYKISEKIIIDGNETDSSWNKIDWSEPFIDIEGAKKPIYKTQVKMVWDTNHFYVLAKIEEPHVWANLKQPDTIIFHNNDFEVFIDPDGDTHNYYEFEFNALNTLWDLFITKPYRESTTVLNDWTATGLKSAVKINGTINNSKDKDQGWVIEMAIPWAVFKTSYFHKNIPVDKFWRINFSRVNWDYDVINGKYQRKKDKKGKLLHEYNWVWSPTGAINMHEPEKWGYVYFSSKNSGEIDVFEIPQDEKIKWKLFEVHRALKKYVKKHKKYPKTIDSIIDSTIRIDDIDINITFENHYTGYNLYGVSPFTKKILIVRDDGKFMSK